MNKQPAGTAATTNRVRLPRPSRPAAEASPEQLRQRIKSTIRAQNQAAAVRAEAVAELERRQGTELVETVLREDGLLGRRRARSEVNTAGELEEPPKPRGRFRKKGGGDLPGRRPHPRPCQPAREPPTKRN